MLEALSEILGEGHPSDVELALQALQNHQIVNPLKVVRDGDEVLAIVFPMFPKPGDKKPYCS